MTVAMILAALLAVQDSREESRAIDPFTIHIFTTPRGSADAAERMHGAVEDAIAITELSDWLFLVEERDEADIVLEVKAYAMTEDQTMHRIFTDVVILGKEMMLVGVDERKHAERLRAVSDFMEKLQDYCAENYVLLDAKRRAPT